MNFVGWWYVDFVKYAKYVKHIKYAKLATAPRNHKYLYVKCANCVEHVKSHLT